jgi:dual-specificity kinase/CDC-like kinase
LIDKQLAGEARELFYDLISRLLNFDPKRRLTSNQAVAHPFFSVNLDQMDWKINTRNGSQLRPKSLEKSRS